jgi:hypothetical protein
VGFSTQGSDVWGNRRNDEARQSEQKKKKKKHQLGSALLACSFSRIIVLLLFFCTYISAEPVNSQCSNEVKVLFCCLQIL